MPNFGATTGRTSDSPRELVWRDIGLTQDAGESSELDLAVQRHHATLGTAAHDDGAPRLAYLHKPQALQRLYDERARYSG